MSGVPPVVWEAYQARRRRRRAQSSGGNWVMAGVGEQRSDPLARVAEMNREYHERVCRAIGCRPGEEVWIQEGPGTDSG